MSNSADDFESIVPKIELKKFAEGFVRICEKQCFTDFFDKKKYMRQIVRIMLQEGEVYTSFYFIKSFTNEEDYKKEQVFEDLSIEPDENVFDFSKGWNGCKLKKQDVIVLEVVKDSIDERYYQIAPTMTGNYMIIKKEDMYRYKIDD